MQGMKGEKLAQVGKKPESVRDTPKAQGLPFRCQSNGIVPMACKQDSV